VDTETRTWRLSGCCCCAGEALGRSSGRWREAASHLTKGQQAVAVIRPFVAATRSSGRPDMEITKVTDIRREYLSQAHVIVQYPQIWPIRSWSGYANR
jgi:hypothetical protein